MKNKKIFSIVLLSMFLWLSTISAYAATNVSISFSGTKTVAPGKSSKIKINFDTNKYELIFDLVPNNANVKISEKRFGNGQLEFTVTGVNEGSTTFKVKSIDGTVMANGDDATASGSLTITVKKPSTPTPKPPTLDDTEGEKNKPVAKTPEQIAAEQLEIRKNTPLISGIEVISNSERMKDSVIKDVKVEKGQYNYRYVLPRSIVDVNLNVKAIDPSVTLTYEAHQVFGEEGSPLEVKIKAVQDVITQEYTFTLEKAKESSTVFTYGNTEHGLLEDDFLNVQMESLGFERHNLDPTDASKGSFFSKDTKNVVLTTTANNEAKWLMLDEQQEVVREVVIVGDTKGTIIIPEVSEAKNKKIQGANTYDTVAVPVPEKLKEVDSTLKFTDTVKGWKYNDEGIITHAVNNEGAVETVHLNQSGDVRSAYVLFDQGSNGFGVNTLTLVLLGVWILTVVGFLIDRKRMNRKIDTLIARRN